MGLVGIDYIGLVYTLRLISFPKYFRMRQLLLCFLPVALLLQTGRKAPTPDNKAEDRLVEKVFVVNLIPNERKLREYLSYHEHVWPEVEAGFRKAGYKQIDLYRYGYLLVMTIHVPEGSDLARMGKIAEGYDKRCQEWNRIMSGYQKGIPGTGAEETWVETQRFYHFQD